MPEPYAGIMIEPLFNNFATAAFFEFIVFAIFEMRFLLTVWRARRGGQTDAWQVRQYICSIPAYEALYPTTRAVSLFACV